MFRAADVITIERGDATLVGDRVGDGPVVLLLHAGGERRTVWTSIAGTLAFHGHRCVAYDLRGHGHGDSGAAGADALSTHAQDVVAMLAREPGPVTVVGASLGGLAALLAIGRAGVPRSVASLVLIDVVPRLDAGHVRAYLNGLRDGFGERPLVADALGPAAGPLRDSVTALADLPVLLVRGERSALNDRAVAAFADDVPHARVAVVPGSGHLVARDQPGALAAVLRSHLDLSPVRARRVAALLDATDAADLTHPGGSVRRHLDRTGDLLASWGAPGWVVDAGRLHAAHGTDGFPRPIGGLTADRIRAAAGARTERLVALYGCCHRRHSFPTLLSDTPIVIDRVTGATHLLSDDLLRAFAELTAANELDVVTRNPSVAAQHGPALARLFARWGSLLSDEASAAWGAWVPGKR